MSTSSRQCESTKALRELGDFLSRLMFQIAVSIVLSGVVTLLIFWGYPKISSSFLTGLLTLDSILIAVVVFLTPYVKDASQFAGFMEKSIEEMHKAANDPTKRLAYSYYSQLASRSLILVVFLPIFAVTPFFISAVLALVALLSFGFPREILSVLSMWITLWCFLSIILAIWKLMIFERTTIKKLI
jgi:hypothetical protein